MKLNNKGFTLIEMLATVAILAILSGVATMGVTRYIEKTQRDAYEVMQKTVYDAATAYVMEKNPAIPATGLTIYINDPYISNDLTDYGYLPPKLEDPSSKGNFCTGNVIIRKTAGGTTQLDSYTYEVNVACKKFTDTKTFTS